MESWRYETFQDLEKPLVERLRGFPREPDMLIYALRSIAALALRAWLRIYHRLRISGCEHLPRDESFVMVANHASHLDALCLQAALPIRRLHRVFPAAAEDYFFVDLPRTAIAAIFVNALPMSRQRNIRQSLDLCRRLLANPGNVLILFPEGTRTRTGEIGEFKAGIGALVGGTSIPVVPCRIEGAFAAWPKGRVLPLPRKVRIRLGAPLAFPEPIADKGAMQRIAETLKRAVLEL
ncbi:MAG: 1-acyl-sn-glycerol-3-phosphate acyltransferase [Planctomycetes bacterium]|nr:1-acyl-sn-glycerol-3-phosphate acyltransferase [Planctomycetota bacterium]